MSHDLAVPRESAVPQEDTVRREVPRLPDDYSAAAARRRLAFLAAETGTRPEHIGRYSFDPAVLAGNIENFTGVAQVPLGIAGPLLVDGEHARGTFYVPLATTEGTLVASYNRGMRKLAEIVAATVLCGEISLGAAVVADEWVTAHERLGRNRP